MSDPETGRPSEEDGGARRRWAGGFRQWDRDDPKLRDRLRRRAAYMRGRGRREWREGREWGGPPWGGGRPWGRRRPGFGCLFGLLFLVVVASLVTATATLLARFEPIPIAIAALVLLFVLARLARGTAGAARDLDRMLAATRRVEDGDYGVRLGRTRSDLPPIQELARGFDTMTARLEAVEEQRRTLLADVSHELRTPLTVITGNLEAIVDGVYPPDPAHLNAILDETRVMERLIDDLRTVSMSEAGTLALHPEPTDPDVLIGEVLKAFGPGAVAAGVQLVSDVPGDLPILDVDPVRVREVLSNLVANALRHTPAGGTVTVRAESSAASVILIVRDTGPGIEPELLGHVFERFVKGQGSRGSGLGLAIARGLVEAHGGSISLDSSVGAGTTFRVELPRSQET